MVEQAFCQYDQAARKARRKERRKAAAKAEIEEGSKTKQESDELGEKVSQIHINKLVKRAAHIIGNIITQTNLAANDGRRS